MTTINHTKDIDTKENNIYESKFWKTTPWNFRWLHIYETFKMNFYLNKVNKIIWFDYGEKVFWKESINTVQMWVWKQILWILKTWENKENLNMYELWFYWDEKKYENEEEFIKEINVAYSFKLGNILLEKE